MILAVYWIDWRGWLNPFHQILNNSWGFLRILGTADDSRRSLDILKRPFINFNMRRSEILEHSGRFLKIPDDSWPFRMIFDSCGWFSRSAVEPSYARGVVTRWKRPLGAGRRRNEKKIKEGSIDISINRLADAAASWLRVMLFWASPDDVSPPSNSSHSWLPPFNPWPIQWIIPPWLPRRHQLQRLQESFLRESLEHPLETALKSQPNLLNLPNQSLSNPIQSNPIQSNLME